LDLAVLNRRAPLEVYQNVTAGGNWITVDVQQDGPNTATVGAFIELRVGDRMITREITIGGGHAGGVLGPQHFGLGEADSVALRVIWPDGTMSDWQTADVNQQLAIRR
jgi:hypothetical protein